MHLQLLLCYAVLEGISNVRFNQVHFLVHIQTVFSHMLAPTFAYYYCEITITQQQCESTYVLAHKTSLIVHGAKRGLLVAAHQLAAEHEM